MITRAGTRVLSENALDGILAEFDTLQEAVIDSSSVIYMRKAGFLRNVSDVVNLQTTEDVIRETGYTDLPVVVRQHRGGYSADDRLVRLALSSCAALISEDRKMLLQMQDRGGRFYNALMMLTFLYYLRRISLSGYHRYLDELKTIAHYKKRVLDFGDQLATHITKQI